MKLALLLTWTLSSPALIVQDTVCASVSRDLEGGKTIATSRCAGCHGAEGQAHGPEVPKLAGQWQEFLVLQLQNYKSGERPHPMMAPVAKALSLQEIADVSAYYASFPPMRGDIADNTADAAALVTGESIFMRGKPGTPACRYCHGDQGQGLAPVFARLAGQHAKFVVASIQPYRKVDDFKNLYAFVMKAVVQNLSDADIEAVASYIESMR